MVTISARTREGEKHQSWCVTEEGFLQGQKSREELSSTEFQKSGGCLVSYSFCFWISHLGEVRFFYLCCQAFLIARNKTIQGFFVFFTVAFLGRRLKGLRITAELYLHRLYRLVCWAGGIQVVQTLSKGLSTLSVGKLCSSGVAACLAYIKELQDPSSVPSSVA